MKGFFKFIFSVLLFVIGIAAIAFVMLVGKTYKANRQTKQVTIIEAASSVKDSLSQLNIDLDSQKTSEVMEYVKQKADDGSLKSVDGIKTAIEEGAQKLDLTISDEATEQIVDALGSLENIGFSPEDIAGRTSDLYTRYGDEFMNHMEEAFVDAAKDAAGNTAKEIWNSVEDTVRNLF